MKIYLFLAGAISFSVNSAVWAADNFEPQYRARYMEEMYSRLSDAVDRGVFLQNYKKEVAKDRLRIFVSLAADCQINSFDHFDPKYKEIAFKEVVAGKSIADSNFTVNTEMLLDVKAGVFTRERLDRIVLESKQEAKVCVDKQMKKAGL